MIIILNYKTYPSQMPGLEHSRAVEDAAGLHELVQENAFDAVVVGQEEAHFCVENREGQEER